MKLGKCCCQSYDSYAHEVIDQLCVVIKLIDILLFQICEEGEKGEVGQLVKNNAIKLFNTTVESQFITVDDASNEDIEGQYGDDTSYDAVYYGAKIFDCSCKLHKLMVKKIVANNGMSEVPLDALTLDSQVYITANVLQNGQVVTYSMALCQLKEHFEFIISSLKKEFSTHCY